MRKKISCFFGKVNKKLDSSVFWVIKRRNLLPPNDPGDGRIQFSSDGSLRSRETKSFITKDRNGGKKLYSRENSELNKYKY